MVDSFSIDRILQEELGIQVTTGARFKKYPPRDFQIEDVKLWLKHQHYGIYHQTGVGKTLSIFLGIIAWIVQGNKVMLITKPSLYEQIKLDWRENIEGLDFSPSQEIGSPLLLMSHTAIKIPRFRQRIGKEYCVLIIDEFHVMRNAEGRRYKTLQVLVDHYDIALAVITGTPITRDLRDSYSCVKLTNPRAYRNYGAFCKAHVTYRKLSNDRSDRRRIVSGFKNEDRLKKALFKYGRRLLKREVWKDLEKPMVVKRAMHLLDSQKAIYEEFSEFLIFENSDGELFDASYSPTLKFQKGLQSITNPSRFEKDAESCILQDILTVAEDVCTDNKLIVFTLFASTAEKYAESLDKYNPALITGKHKGFTKFTTDNTCRVLVATLGAGAEGYSFQEVCSHLYLAEYLPITGWVEQAANRIYRPNQIEAPTVYVPHVMGTLYISSLLAKLKERGDSNKKVVDTDFSIT